MPLPPGPCHGPSPATVFPEGRPARVIALAGNPNVGKSTLFNQVTGLGVVTAHYAGKTAEINVGETRVDDTEFAVIDLPGTYGLTGPHETAWTARRALYEVAPDVTVVVLDATNLSRNLVLALEVLDLGKQTVLVLNLSDEARRAGVRVDPTELARVLGVPAFETVAVDGIGVAAVMEYAALAATGRITVEVAPPRYDESFERAVSPLVNAVKTAGAEPFGLGARATALRLLAGDPEVADELDRTGVAGVSRVASEAQAAVRALMGEPASQVLARQRHRRARIIAEQVQRAPVHETRRVIRGLTSLATRPVTGVPLLIAMLLAVFLVLFFVGEALAGVVATAWSTWASPVVREAVHAVAGQGTLAETLLWGFDAGLEASLAIGIPYILTFYLLLAVLEDTGYLNAVAFLADRVMHRVGLHGRSAIPLVAGLGCSVPAVLSVRLLRSDRERFIGATLVAMVPCSARSAVVLGAVGHYLGVLPALGVYVLTAVLAATVGTVLDRTLPGASGGLVMEMFPFRRPALRIVVRKAWEQFREFLAVALPIVLAGSIVLGGLYETGWLWRLSAPMAPVVSWWLGLPAVAGLTLLFGLLRKEFALQLLTTLAIATMGAGSRDLLSFMSPTDVFVYVLVNTLALPCVSTLAVLGRVLGWRRAAGIAGITIGVALVAGGVFARVLPVLGVGA